LNPFFVVLLIFLFSILFLNQLYSRYHIPNQIKKIKKYLKEGNLSSGRNLIDKLLTKKINDPIVKWYKALYEIKQGWYILGMVTLNEILRDNMFSPEVSPERVHEELAHIYEKTGRKKEALTEYYALAELNQGSFEANLKIGVYLFEYGTAKESEEYLKKAYIANSASVFPSLFLGKLYKVQEDLKKSESYLSRVIQINPEHEEALYLMGEILYESKDFVTAAGYFDNCGKQKGNFRNSALVKKGLCEALNQNDEAAIELLSDNLGDIEKRSSLWSDALKELIRLEIHYKKFNDLEKHINSYISQVTDAQEMLRLRKIFNPIFRNPKLKEFASLNRSELLVALKGLLKNHGLMVDEVRNINKDILMTRVSRLIKTGQKIIQLIFYYLKPKLIEPEVIHDIQNIMKRERVRIGFLLTPFDFTEETIQIVKSLSIAPLNGEKLNLLIKGGKIF